MSFKENLLRKLRIDDLSKKVSHSMGPPDSGRRIDKAIAREFLGMGQFEHRKERDLDLYLFESETGEQRVLVLDNEFAIYKTTPEDVALRKSPTLKEMLKIRNAIKILGDKDVVVSKKDESVAAVRKECVANLDLSFTESDLDEIEKDGAASLEKAFADGVIEALSLFRELLGYAAPPKAFRIGNQTIIGKSDEKSGVAVFGPMAIYSVIHNSLKLVREEIKSTDKEKLEFLHRVASGKEKADAEGPEVFGFLKDKVDRNRTLPVSY